MPDSYTAFLNLTKPEVGASPNTWGTKFNTNLDTIDANAKSLDTAVKAARAVADAAVKRGGDTMTGGLGVFTENAQVMLNQNGGTYNGFAWNIMNFSGDGNLYFQDYQGGKYVDNAAYFTRAGDLVLGKGYGSVRAAIKAAQDTATGAANQKVAKAGDIMTGDLEVQKANPGMWLHYPGVQRGKWWMRNDGSVLFSDQSNADWLSVSPGGAVWTRQVGDLKSYIDNTAAARAAKTGDTFTGQVVIKYNYPGLELRANDAAGFPYIDLVNETKNNVDFAWRLQTNGATADQFVFTGADGGAKLSVGQDGSIWTSQIGDLNTRIETRASAIADNRLATARAEYGLKVNKSGDTMSGDLNIQRDGSAGVRFIVPNQTDWFLRGIGGNRMQFCDGAATVEYLSFGADGSVSTRQFGDLNNRIESRASAHANAAIQGCVQSGRWVHAGDKGYNDQPGTGGFISPFGPHAMHCDYWSWRFTAGDGQVGSAPFAQRFRVYQMYTPAAGWVTSGAAS